MRRHHQKNTLLPKMICVAVVINAILLPVMAKLGVFKKFQGERLTQVALVKLPPPEKNPEVHKHIRIPPRPHQAPHGAKEHATSSHPLPPNPNQPKVVAAAAPGTDTGEPTIANNGTAAPGQVVAPPTPQVSQAAAVLPPPPVVVPKHAPTPAPAPAPSAAPPPAPHRPIVVAAQPVNRPEPTIPAELLSEQRDATYLALFTIKANGSVTVTGLKGTGNATLDRLALEAARNWTFRPATKDGQPVDSYLRLQIEFRVTD